MRFFMKLWPVVIPFMACRCCSKTAMDSSTFGQICGGRNRANVLQCSPLKKTFCISIIWCSDRTEDRNTHPVPYVTCDLPLEMSHHFLDDPAIDKWQQRAYILTSVSPLICSSSPSPLLYLGPPWTCMSTPPTAALQLTLLTDRCLLVSFPNFTTEVTSTLNIARLTVPLVCLKNSQNKQSQCTSVLGRHLYMQPTPYTAGMINSPACDCIRRVIYSVFLLCLFPPLFTV